MSLSQINFHFPSVILSLSKNQLPGIFTVGKKFRLKIGSCRGLILRLRATPACRSAQDDWHFVSLKRDGRP
jgi:hypothetical protein